MCPRSIMILEVFFLIPPQRPRIEFNGTQVLPGHNLTTLHGEVAVIKCVSHYGNPPPVLKWFLDQQEITPTRRQTNTTELDNPRTWLAVSVLELTISKDNHGRMLRCVAVHESYSTKSSSIEIRLDVMFVPETRLVGIPTADIEDLKDSIAIRCVVSSNPKASVVWRREGQNQPASLQELLQFSPAIRQHSGLYTCHARNKAGDSVPIRVQIDVKYRPKIISVGRERVKTATLFSPVNFECLGEGNPPPTYQWLQRKSSAISDSIIERGREAKIHISNVTYEYQGEWRCKVTNIIKGEEQSEISEPIILQVHGAPQVLRQSATPELYIESGQSADLSMVVCADPRPRSVAWEWGSLRLEAGNEMGKFKVDDVTQEAGEDCYLTTLHVKDTSATDSRTYYLLVENDKGKDTHAVQLYVNEPLQMSTLVSVAGALLVAFLIMVCACIYAIRAEKCCFSRKGDFKPSEIDGQKVDIEKTAHHLTKNQTQPPTMGPGGIPADAIYTTGPRGGGHPDAMKTRRRSDESLSSDLDYNHTKRKWPLWKKIVVWSVVALSVLVLLLFILIWVVVPVVFMLSIGFQRMMIFMPFNSPKYPNFNDPKAYGIDGVINFYIAVADYPDNKTITKIGAWLVLPEDEIGKVMSSEDIPAIIRDTQHDILIFMHGVYCNRAKPLWHYGVLRKDFMVIAVDHRGYGDSGLNVEMTESGMVRDYLQIYDFVMTKQFSNDIYFWGHSLGSAISCHTVKALKDQRNVAPKGLILESSFTTVAEEIKNSLLGKMFKWLVYFDATVLDPLDKNGIHFNSSKNILDVDCPIMLMHAEDDGIVPWFLGQKLAHIATTQRNMTNQGNVTLHVFPYRMGYGHNDITRDPNVPQYIKEFKEVCRNFTSS